MEDIKTKGLTLNFDEFRNFIEMAKAYLDVSYEDSCIFKDFYFDLLVITFYKNDMMDQKMSLDDAFMFVSGMSKDEIYKGINPYQLGALTDAYDRTYENYMAEHGDTLNGVMHVAKEYINNMSEAFKGIDPKSINDMMALIKEGTNPIENSEALKGIMETIKKDNEKVEKSKKDEKDDSGKLN